MANNKYKAEQEKNPLLSAWICVDLDSKKAFCKACKISISAEIRNMKRHARESVAHQTNVLSFLGIEVNDRIDNNVNNVNDHADTFVSHNDHTYCKNYNYVEQSQAFLDTVNNEIDTSLKNVNHSISNKNHVIFDKMSHEE